MFSCFGSGPFGESEEGNEPSPQTIIHTHLNTIPGFTGGGCHPLSPTVNSACDACRRFKRRVISDPPKALPPKVLLFPFTDKETEAQRLTGIEVSMCWSQDLFSVSDTQGLEDLGFFQVLLPGS